MCTQLFLFFTLDLSIITFPFHFNSVICYTLSSGHFYVITFSFLSLSNNTLFCHLDLSINYQLHSVDPQYPVSFRKVIIYKLHKYDINYKNRYLFTRMEIVTNYNQIHSSPFKLFDINQLILENG